MREYFLAGTGLFQGMAEEEIRAMLQCLGAREQCYEKGELICRAGERLRAVGLFLEGSATIESCDLWGGRMILDHVGPGQIFGEVYACLPEEPLLVDVAATEHARVLFLEVDRVLRVCSNSCVFHSRLIRNLLTLTAKRNLGLSRRSFHISHRTIRERVLSYLSEQSVRQNSREITIPFDRQQMADYLNVDRSALSAELGKMRREGILEFERNRFRLPEAGERGGL